jgi:hypothetical protein
MRNLLLAVALLLASCASLDSAASTYSADTAAGLAGPITERIIYADESVDGVVAEEAVEVYTDLTALGDALLPHGGPMALRLAGVAATHDLLVPTITADERQHRLWLGSSALLLELVLPGIYGN